MVIDCDPFADFDIMMLFLLPTKLSFY